jgi:hypothetical protein
LVETKDGFGVGWRREQEQSCLQLRQLAVEGIDLAPQVSCRGAAAPRLALRLRNLRSELCDMSVARIGIAAQRAHDMLL